MILGGGVVFCGGIWMFFCAFGESFDVGIRILPFIHWSGNVTFIIFGILLAIFGVGIIILGIQTIRDRTKGGDVVSAELEVKGKGLPVLADAKKEAKDDVIYIRLYNDNTAVNAQYNGKYLGRIDDATEILKFVKRNRIESAYILKGDGHRSYEGFKHRVYIQLR